MFDVEFPEGDFNQQQMDGIENDSIYLKRKRNTDEFSYKDINNTCKIPKTQTNKNKMAIQAALAMTSSLFESLKNKFKKPNSINIKDVEDCQKGVIDLINSSAARSADCSAPLTVPASPRISVASPAKKIFPPGTAMPRSTRSCWVAPING